MAREYLRFPAFIEVMSSSTEKSNIE